MTLLISPIASYFLERNNKGPLYVVIFERYSLYCGDKGTIRKHNTHILADILVG